MGLKELTKNTFILALPKVITFVLKLIRAKLNAVFLGAEGVGIVNQLNEILTQLVKFSNLSLNVGAKKIIVDYDKDKQKRIEIPKIVGLFGLITILLVLIIFIIGLFFINDLSSYFLKNQPKGLFLAAFLVFPIVSLRVVPKTTLSGLMEFKAISKTEIIVAVASFLIYIPLIILFGIEGAVTNIVITNILFLGTFSYITFYKTARKRGQNLIYFKNLKINKSSLKEFATISSASSILGLYGVFCHLSVRGILASNLGMEKIGIYVPIIAWSGFFSTFFVPALIQYIFPKYGKCATNNEIKTVANDGLRLVSFIILPFVLIIISFSDLLIPLFYSKDFLEATVFLPLHFIGIFFWTWMRVLKQIMIPTGKTKQLVPFAIAESSLYLLVVYLFVDKIGLWSWTLRYSLVPFLLFFSYIIYHIQTINFNIFRKNIFLMLYGLTASSLVYYIVLNIKGLYFMRGIIVLVLILVLYLFMQKREREIAFQYKNQYKNKIKRIFKK